MSNAADHRLDHRIGVVVVVVVGVKVINEDSRDFLNFYLYTKSPAASRVWPESAVFGARVDVGGKIDEKLCNLVYDTGAASFEVVFLLFLEFEGDPKNGG